MTAEFVFEDADNELEEFIRGRSPQRPPPRHGPTGRRPSFRHPPRRPTVVAAPRLDLRPRKSGAVTGCGTLVVLDGFRPGDAHLLPHHYGEILIAAVSVARVNPGTIEIVGGGRGGQAREVLRQLEFALQLTGTPHRVRLSASAAAGDAVEIRMCGGGAS